MVAHVSVLLAMLWVRPEPIRMAEPLPVTVVELVAPPPVRPRKPPAPPSPVPAPPEPAKATPAKAPPPKPAAAQSPLRSTPTPPLAPPLPAARKPTPRAAITGPASAAATSAQAEDSRSTASGAGVEVSDAQLAGAATAGSGRGGGGGDCDMLRRLQAALRRDARVQAAVAQAHHGKAIMVWNGDWIRHLDQEGAGLAQVREAMMWEIGFAPPACRTERVHGLVLISLSDAPGAPRLVLGSGAWRWSDLLFARSTTGWR